MDRFPAASEFAEGAACLMRGLGVFCGRPRLWKYAAIPMGILLALYMLVLALLIWLGIPYLEGFLPDPDGWSVWLRWLVPFIRLLIWITAVAVALLTGTVLLCTFYEAVGTVFFDGLVRRFEREEYGLLPAETGRWNDLVYLGQSACYAAGTVGWTLLLAIPCFLLPAVGVLLPAAVVGYRFGVTALFPPGFSGRTGVPELRRLAASRRWLMLGFGGPAYLLLLIPFSALLLLPGMAVGGSILFREKLAPPEGKKQFCSLRAGIFR